MKKTLITLLALATVVATPAFAQQPTAESIFIAAQNESEYLARDLLITAKVHNDEGKIIGDIEDIVLNDWNRVEGVVMGTGGFLGVAEKKVGVKLSALKFSEKDGKTYITLPGVTKEMLTAVEPFKRAKPKKTLLERAMEKAQELTDKGTVTAKEAYDKAKEQAGPAYEKAKEAAKSTYEQTKEAVKEAVDKAKDAAAPAPKQ
ncbi:MAG: PRC-barrel domain-containing protein [Hyphomicrobiaceae bacterium]